MRKVLFGAFFFLCDFFSSVPGMSGRPHSLQWPPASNRSPRAATEGNQVLTQSGSLPAEKFDQYEPFDPQPAESSTPQWKQEVNQRLAAHRSRRGGPQDAAGGRTDENPRVASSRAAEAAARVAARYAKAPSYKQLLAGEARAVVRAAGAAAEAARNAQAAAQAVLFGLETGSMASGLWEPAAQEPEPESNAGIAPAQSAPPRWQDEPPAAVQAAAQMTPYAGAQPRWEEALPVTSPAPQAGRDVWSEMRVHPGLELGRNSGEGELFPEESFEASGSFESFDPFDSYDPMGSAMVEPVQHLPANLIEFPRELVATRKARPRLAEGPFYDASHHNSQLSIFEVDPASLDAPAASAQPAVIAPPEWASIELEHPPEPSYTSVSGVPPAQPINSHAAEAYISATGVPAGYATAVEVEESAAEEIAPALPDRSEAKAIQYRSRPSDSTPVAVNAQAVELLVARLSDRLLAAVVDGALVTLAFLAAAVVVVASTAHPPTGRIALIASGCGWLLFGLLYQFLFLSYAEEGTPGMRYARIALCTFDDDNPTVEQMRQRIPALLMAAVPAGLGLAWAFFDREHLGWHDRLTKTYQRKY
jgi:uncharacterized RDD family membrane protein YckC